MTEVPHGRRRATLTLFCGPPGAGKTTLARRLEADGAGLRLCTDDWQSDLGVEQSDEAFHEVLQARLYRHALGLLGMGVDVILEDGLWTQDERAEKFADARAVGARIHWHVFDVPVEELWRRVSARQSEPGFTGPVLSHDYLRWAAGVFQPPTEAELAQVDRYWVHRV